MSKIGIPISEDDFIEKEVNGITYYLYPPVGSIEKQLRKLQRSAYDLMPYYDKAEKSVDAKNKGKKWQPGERMEAIVEAASELAEREFLRSFDQEKNENRTRDIFDLLCSKWVGAPCGKKKKSDQVPFFIQEKICSWYLGQMELSGEDRKN